MAGRRELGFPKISSCSLREQLARTMLKNVRSQGHTYVELREDGKRFVFFCTLCLSPCYSDSVLFDHLKGNLHTERLAAAKVTLLKPNPWPFNDGVLFFDNSTENDKHLAISNGNESRLLECQNNDNNLAIVKYGESSKDSCSGHVGLDGVHSVNEPRSHPRNLNGNGGNSVVVIPNVLINDEISDLKVRFIGLGQIAARYCEKDEGSNVISRIWCEWLGKEGPGDDDTFKAPEHDFAVVTFTYKYDLGRRGLIDVKSLLSSSPPAELENDKGTSRKRKESFSDPEDTSESLSNQYDSSGEDASVSDNSSSRLWLDRYADQLLNTRFISNKAMRRELRKQQRIAAERMCDICQHKMLPEKDVATLMDMKKGKLACSSRNVNGAFHLFHTSCLIHWILLCEFEILTNQSGSPKVGQRSKRENRAEGNEVGEDDERKATKSQIFYVFCPACQGTGVDIEGDELEIANIPLSEMFKYKIKAIDARKAWMKSPEVLQNCSTGFHFPSQFEEIVEEKVSPLKLLQFYSAEE